MVSSNPAKGVIDVLIPHRSHNRCCVYSSLVWETHVHCLCDLYVSVRFVVEYGK